MLVCALGLALAWLCFVQSERAGVVDATPASSSRRSADAAQPDVTLDLVEETPSARHSPEESRGESAQPPLAPHSAQEPPNATWHRLAVRVLDARTREPIARCRLMFAQPDRSTGWFTTDGGGRIETNAVFVSGSIDVRLTPSEMGVDDSVASIEPNRIWIDANAGPSQLVEVELLATRSIPIEVRVQNDDGTPANGAMLSVSLDADRALVADHEQRNELKSNFMAHCDDAATCTFWVSPKAGAVCRLSMIAFHTGGIGANETIEPPLAPAKVVLVLDRGRNFSVRVVDPRGVPVAGAKVELMSRSDGSQSFALNETTDESGVAAFSKVPNGAFDLGASHESSRRLTETTIELAPDHASDVEIVLPDSPERLAVRGVVLDENGEPLDDIDVRVESPRGGVGLQTDSNGTFEAWMPPSDALIVEVGSTALSDVFDPPRGPVEFGTTSFVARRSRVPTRTRVRIQIVGRDTGKPIPNARIDSAARSDGVFSEERSKDGWASLNVTDRPDACLLFSAAGYKSVLRECRELLPPLARPDDITIELERGFERRLTFVDGDTSEPLSGVTMTHPSGAVVRADGGGNVFLSAPEWPTHYRVECDGYPAFDWEPTAFSSWKRVMRLEKMIR